MKLKIVLSIIIAILILVVSLPISFATVEPYITKLPDPIYDKNHAYFINDYRFIDFEFLNGKISEDLITLVHQNNDNYLGSLLCINELDSINIHVEQYTDSNNIDRYRFNFINYSRKVVSIFFQPYTLSTGEKYGPYVTFNLQPATYTVDNNTGLFSITPYILTTGYQTLPAHEYYDCYNITLDPSVINNGTRRTYLFGSDSTINNSITEFRNLFSTMNTWLQGALVTLGNDVNAQYTLLNNVIRPLLISVLDMSLSDIDSHNQEYFDLVSAYLAAFFATGHQGTLYSWNYYVNQYVQGKDIIYNFASDFNFWYHTYYIPKTDLTNDILQDILDALTETDNPPTTDQAFADFSDALSEQHEVEMSIINGQMAQAEDMGEEINLVGIVSHLVMPGEFKDCFGWINDALYNIYYPEGLANNALLFMIPCVIGLLVYFLGKKVR